jgi:hypothetical protein
MAEFLGLHLMFACADTPRNNMVYGNRTGAYDQWGRFVSRAGSEKVSPGHDPMRCKGWRSQSASVAHAPRAWPSAAFLGSLRAGCLGWVHGASPLQSYDWNFQHTPLYCLPFTSVGLGCPGPRSGGEGWEGCALSLGPLSAILRLEKEMKGLSQAGCAAWGSNNSFSSNNSHQIRTRDRLHGSTPYRAWTLINYGNLTGAFITGNEDYGVVTVERKTV